jgi:hypothetical protein
MNSQKRAVTLEELVRVKRAERPPPEFWDQFEREMRVKQLAAIVEPKPWWAPFIRVGARVSRHQVPIGAAAILLLSFVSIREYRTAEFRPVFVPEVSHPVTEIENIAESSASAERQDAEAIATSVTSISTTPRSEVAAAPLTTSNPVSVNVATQVGTVAHVVPLMDRAPAAVEPTPSARYIAANLAAVRATDPSIVNDVFAASVRVKGLREPVRDPLTQINTNGESRRSRFLTTALPAIANSSDVSVGTSDRVARRLTEDRLYDSISRVGVRGDRVAIKF